VEPAEIVFCASGTEAANLAILGSARRVAADRPLVTWAAEHQAVLAPMRKLQVEGWTVSVLEVDQMGRALSGRVPAEAGLVSLGLANNETGVIQPVAEVTGLLDRGTVFHLDCCQGPRWLQPPLGRADLASFSGHKLGAGRGGLLYVRRGLRLDPPFRGGPQEWGLRAGREDVAAATAVAVALQVCAARRQAAAAAVAPLAVRLQRLLDELGGRSTGDEPRLPNYATAAFARRRGEDMLLGLDLAGLAASSGSACASGSLDPSHVLLAMGLSLEEALGSLRLTLGYDTSPEEVEHAGAILGRVLQMAGEVRAAGRG
jgi:cysteine desulfurase